MNEIISTVILVAMLCSGATAADRIYHAVQTAALTKAAHGLPSLGSFAHALTSHKTRAVGARKRRSGYDVR
jgi:hypothetical protein